MPALITLLTDFGVADGYVGIMKGVIRGIAPSVQIVDLSHEVAPQDIRAGALILRSAVPFFPRETVYVAVVDPGVGSARAAVVVRSRRGSFFVGPDNGLLTPAVEADGGAVGIWRIENPAYIRSMVSQTFHGRDVFAPAAAHLVTGAAAERFGTGLPSLTPLALPEPERAATRVRGEVIYVDRFGNLVTNISQSDLDAVATTGVSVSMPNVPDVPYVTAYAHAAPNAPLAIINSWGLLEIAVRDGNAARQLGAAQGAVVTVSQRAAS